MFLSFVKPLRPMVCGPVLGVRRGRRREEAARLSLDDAVPWPEAEPLIAPPFAAPLTDGGSAAPPFAVDWLFEAVAADTGGTVVSATTWAGVLAARLVRFAGVFAAGFDAVAFGVRLAAGFAAVVAVLFDEDPAALRVLVFAVGAASFTAAEDEARFLAAGLAAPVCFEAAAALSAAAGVDWEASLRAIAFPSVGDGTGIVAQKFPDAKTSHELVTTGFGDGSRRSRHRDAV